MSDLFFPEVPVNQRATALGLEIMPATFGEGFGAAFEETLTRNPTASAFRATERARYRNGAYVDEFGNEQTTGRVPSNILSSEEASAKYGLQGRLKFDAPTPEPVAENLYRLKVRELELQDTKRRANAGIGTALTAGVLGSLMDPLNVALAFVPVVGPARQAAMAARMGVGGARVATGAIEGAVGAALIEPLVLGVATEEQADYTAVDSLANIVFGSAIGGGLHFSAGYIGDRFKARAESAALPKLIDSLPQQDQAALLRTAVAQIVEGRPVDATPVLDAAVAGRVAIQERIEGVPVFQHMASGEIVELRSEPMWFSKEGEDFYVGDRPVGENGNQVVGTLKAQIDMQSPFIESRATPEDFKKVSDAWKENGLDPELQATFLKDAPYEFGGHMAPGLVKALRSLGYDGVIADLSWKNGGWAIPFDAAKQVRVVDATPGTIRPGIQEAVAKAQEPHIDKADSDGIAVAEQRVAEEANVKSIDDEATRMQEEVAELEAYSPEGVEPSQAVKDAAKEASLYERAWKAAAACGMRKA
jgi:hypothetical protein